MPGPVTYTVTTTPKQVWSGRAAASSGISTLLLLNTDLVNTVKVGTDFTSIVVPVAPNGSLSVDPSSNWYVQGTTAGTAPLVVVPNGQGNFLGLTQGLGNLAIPSVQSPNFDLSNPSASPNPSWAVLQSGIAYFVGLVLSGGTITGPDYIINTSGIFIYSGTPANGNLIGSWAGSAGSDGFGNTYPQGFSISKGSISGSIFLGVDFILNVSGFFLYSGTPANGNLIMCWAVTSGTDQFGNAYPAGITIGNNVNPQVNMQSSGGTGILQFLMNNASYTAMIIRAITGQVAFGGAANTASGHTDSVQTQYNASNGGAGVSANYEMIYVDISGGAHFYLTLSDAGVSVPAGSINAVAPGTGTLTNPASSEVKHQASLINGWQGSGAQQNGLWYWLTAENEVSITADIINPGNVFANSICAVLPAAYRPPQNLNLAGVTQNPAAASPWLFVDTSGNVQVTGMPNPADEIFINVRYPLAAL